MILSDFKNLIFRTLQIFPRMILSLAAPSVFHVIVHVIIRKERESPEKTCPVRFIFRRCLNRNRFPCVPAFPAFRIVHLRCPPFP